MKFTFSAGAIFLIFSAAQAATILVESITDNATNSTIICPEMALSSSVANGSNSTVCFTSSIVANESNSTLSTTAAESYAVVYAEPISRLDQIVKSGVLRFGSAANGGYKPFIAPLSNGTNGGIDMDMGASLAAALGVKLEFIQSSWSTLMQDYRDDKFDLAMGGITITLARQLEAYFSNGYLADGKAPIALCANKDKYTTVAEMNKPGVRVDVFPGGTNEAWALANIVKANIVMEPANGVQGQWLLKNKTDVMVTDLVETEMLQHLHPKLCAIDTTDPLTHDQFGILLPRDMPFKLFVDQWLTMNSGFVSARVKYWLNYDW